VWSYVLDTDYLSVTLDDGRKFDAKLLAADPRLELAVIKFEGADLPHFDLAAATEAEPGSGVLAFSNLFGVATGDEAASVQRGIVSVKTKLEARRGTFETPFRGSVYVVDAITNNPGAAGGALTDRQGRLLGMLGKELRNSANGTWLNYALPVGEMRTTVEDMLAGRYAKRPIDEQQAKPKSAWSVEQLGFVLVPDVLDRTPPYIDAVRPNSPAARAGLQVDDLVMFVGDRLVPSARSLRSELEYIDRGDPVKVVIMRANELVEVTLEGEQP
jgi:serine protease Do